MLAEATHWRHFHRNYLSVKRLWRRPSIKPGEDFLKQFVIQVWFKTVDPTCFEGSTIKHIEKEKFVCPLVPLVWITTIFCQISGLQPWDRCILASQKTVGPVRCLWLHFAAVGRFQSGFERLSPVMHQSQRLKPNKHCCLGTHIHLWWANFINRNWLDRTW
jgi:hypothetical protein